jgi:hypothetical protein
MVYRSTTKLRLDLAVELGKISYRSLEQLDQTFNLAVEQYDDERNNNHWRKIASELQRLAKIAGKYK